MTTPTYPSVTDELLKELEAAATDSKLNIYRPFGWAHSVRCGNHMQADFDFLSLVSPETVLALTAELSSLRAENAELAKDAGRLNKLDELCEAYGFQDIHEGNRWMIDGPFRNVRDAIDAMEKTKC